MMNIPDVIWPQMFEFFISFLNSEKVLGLKKSSALVEVDAESHKSYMEAIDSCIEAGFEENGFCLCYAIKYFTVRKSYAPHIVKKIAPMVIHPHLWVREQAK